MKLAVLTEVEAGHPRGKRLALAFQQAIIDVSDFTPIMGMYHDFPYIELKFPKQAASYKNHVVAFTPDGYMIFMNNLTDLDGSIDVRRMKRCPTDHNFEDWIIGKARDWTKI